MQTGVPSGSWTVNLADGSANGWHFEQKADGPVTWAYDPITPAESSTGLYSGGEPGEGVLTPAQVTQLWAAIAAVEGDTAHHIDARAKGTWKLAVTGATPSDHLASAGPGVDAVVAFLATVHTP